MGKKRTKLSQYLKDSFPKVIINDEFFNENGPPIQIHRAIYFKTIGADEHYLLKDDEDVIFTHTMQIEEVDDYGNVVGEPTTGLMLVIKYIREIWQDGVVIGGRIYSDNAFNERLLLSYKDLLKSVKTNGYDKKISDSVEFLEKETKRLETILGI